MCLIHDNVMLAALFELGRHRQFSVERLACFLAAARRERRILDRSDEGGDRPTCRGASPITRFSPSKPSFFTLSTHTHIVSNQNSSQTQLRPKNERHPMGPLTRRTLQSHGYISRPLWNCFHYISKRTKGATINATNMDNHLEERNLSWDTNEEDGGGGEYDRPQYTLESRRVGRKSSLPCLKLRQKFCYCCSRTTLNDEDENDNVDGKGSYFLFVDVNTLISGYLSWSFRTSYFLLFLAFSVFYFTLILVFALIFYVFVSYYPECVTSAGMVVGTGEDAKLFGDIFQLSWTTFSTVGYGIVYPSTGASGFKVPEVCVGLGVIGSFEAFVGVLYAGFCGAILFGKVIRSQSQAQVFFSDPIVIRFGKKELAGHGDEDNAAATTGDEETGGGNLVTINEGSKDKEHNIPCPSLEFRLVNRLHDVNAGEIGEYIRPCRFNFVCDKFMKYLT